MPAFKQLTYLWLDIKRIVNGRNGLWYSVWFMPSFMPIFVYRINRFLYLLLGGGWTAGHFLLSPLLFLLRPWLGGCEIHYKAEIGPGFLIMHASLGVVISPNTSAGENLTLVGGNCIGIKLQHPEGKIVIGDNVRLGAQASILGPVKIGSNVEIGMSALVLSDTPDNVSMVGVPAHVVQSTNNV